MKYPKSTNNILGRRFYLDLYVTFPTCHFILDLVGTTKVLLLCFRYSIELGVCTVLNICHLSLFLTSLVLHLNPRKLTSSCTIQGSDSFEGERVGEDLRNSMSQPQSVLTLDMTLTLDLCFGILLPLWCSMNDSFWPYHTLRPSGP